MKNNTNGNSRPMRVASILLASLVAACVSSCQTNSPETRFSAADPGDFVVGLPRRFKPISIDGRVYYHSRGEYFQKRGAGYAKVSPPTSTLRAKRSISYRSLYNESAERRKLRRMR
ncbi:MAG: hypothetical protein P1U86_09290 [Verrucomicrobiales bacterium]|nr:hypothetical protein [Verrucomicrobiales bacterium]